MHVAEILCWESDISCKPCNLTKLFALINSPGILVKPRRRLWVERNQQSLRGGSKLKGYEYKEINWNKMIEKKNKSAFQLMEFGFVDGQNIFCVRFEESNVS